MAIEAKLLHSPEQALVKLWLELPQAPKLIEDLVLSLFSHVFFMLFQGLSLA